MPKLPSHLTKEEMEYQQFVRSTVSNWVNTTPEYEKVVDLYQRIGPSWSINDYPLEIKLNSNRLCKMSVQRT